MQKIIADKYESILTLISFGYLSIFMMVQWVFHDYLISGAHIPTWWRAISTILVFSWIISGPLFGGMVLIRGKKLMKKWEYQDSLLKNTISTTDELKKLTKEEEDKKYGL